MKRKILQVGRSSLAVSLPKEYVDSHHLTQGEELDVAVHGTKMIIRCDEPSAVNKHVDIRELTLSDDSEKLIDKLLGALFKQGADSYTILCAHQEHIDIIRSILQRGKVNMYEEPDNISHNTITVHSSIKLFDQNNLDILIKSTIKQVYRIVDNYIELLSHATLTDSKKKELISQDSLINDQVDICKRIINKDVTNYKSTTVYSFIDKIEKIGDEVKYLIESSDIQFAKKHIDLLCSIKEFFNMLYLTNTGFTIKKISEFYSVRSHITKELMKIEDPAFYHHCQNIMELIKDAYSDLMTRDI